MERVQAIVQHKVFRTELARIEALEQDRIYCKHGLEHLLAVARCACLLNLERNAGVAKPLIYAAALLHDIGRGVQYETGENHRESGIALAVEILADTTFTQEEQEAILACVRMHGGSSVSENSLLSLIQEADHRCRPCFLCPASATCYWPEENRNLELTL